MSQPVYKVWFMRYKQPWYELTAEKQKKLIARDKKSLPEVGCEVILSCSAAWASEKWVAWGVDKYPSLEALQQHAQNLQDMEWFNYVEAEGYLGIEMPQE